VLKYFVKLSYFRRLEGSKLSKSSGHHGGGGNEGSGGGNEGGGSILLGTGGVGGADEDLTISPGSSLSGAVLAEHGDTIGVGNALTGFAWGGIIAGSSVLNGGWGFGGGGFLHDGLSSLRV